MSEALDQSSPSRAIGKLTVTEVQIISVSIKPERTMNIAYIKNFEGVKSHLVIEECKNQAHDDLIGKMNNLIPHFAIISDLKESYVKEKQIHPSNTDLESLQNIKVSGYQLKNIEDNKSIIITGQKKIKNRALCFNTPNMKFEDNSNQYEHAEHLQCVINEIEEEVFAYMNGKFAPPSQQVMALPETEEETEVA